MLHNTFLQQLFCECKYMSWSCMLRLLLSLLLLLLQAG
jgi:hypothetical protein